MRQTGSVFLINRQGNIFVEIFIQKEYLMDTEIYKIRLAQWRNLINEANKHDDRSCKFVCNIVYYDGIKYVTCEGILNGFISKECRGDNGFGFDEIFELFDGRTLAELSSSEKNDISARTLALKDLRKKL